MVFYKDANISLAGDHLRAICNLIAPVAYAFTSSVQYFGELFEDKLHKVYLAFITALDSIELSFVTGIQLIDDKVDIINRRLVFRLRLIRFELLLGNF